MALEYAILASASPAETAARLSRLAGLPLEPDPAGGFRLRLPGAAGAAGPEAPELPHHASASCRPRRCPRLLPGVTRAGLPFIGRAW